MNTNKQGTAKNVSAPKSSARNSVRSVQGSATFDYLGQLRPHSDESGASQKAASSTDKATPTENERSQEIGQSLSTSLPDEQNPLPKVIALIKSARKKQGLTQQHLADSVGVHVSFIAHLETLKESGALPSYTRTAALERVLGLKERELWELTEAVRALKGSRRAQALKEFHDLELELKGLLSKPEPVNQTGKLSESAAPLVNNKVQVEVEDDEEFDSVSEMCNDFTAILGGDSTHRKQAGLALRQIVEKAREENNESQKDDSKKD